MITQKEISERFYKIALMMEHDVIYKTTEYNLDRHSVMMWTKPNHTFYIKSHMIAANELYKQLKNKNKS